jgi:hypothetical protein
LITCKRCGETKPDDEYYATSEGKPASKCKECVKMLARARHAGLRIVIVPGKRFCKCGCGAVVTNEWVQGHQWRAKPDYLVDDATGCWLWQRCIDKQGYGKASRDGESLAHRWMYLKTYGYVPANLDHICRNRSCINPMHLRPASPAENAQNRAPEGNQNGRSRYRGVYWSKQLEKWGAKVSLNGSNYFLGCFEDEDEAGAIAAAFRAEHMPFSDETHSQSLS